MRYIITSVKDLKSGFIGVSLSDNDDTAVRNFAFAVNQPGMLKEYPQDYQLFKIGAFDTETGIITPCSESQMSCLADASTLVKKEVSDEVR